MQESVDSHLDMAIYIMITIDRLATSATRRTPRLRGALIVPRHLLRIALARPGSCCHCRAKCASPRRAESMVDSAMYAQLQSNVYQ